MRLEESHHEFLDDRVAAIGCAGAGPAGAVPSWPLAEQVGVALCAARSAGSARCSQYLPCDQPPRQRQGLAARAVQSADAASGTTIKFAHVLSGTITLTSGELELTSSMTINGPGR